MTSIGTYATIQKYDDHRKRLIPGIQAKYAKRNNRSKDRPVISHRQPSLVTKLTTTSPKEERCDRFHQFLDEVTDGDVGLQEFLQVMFGACLSGAPEAHWMAFILGPTRSGKSVIVELLAHIMGSYAHTH